MGNTYKKGRKETDEENDYYRVPRIWSTILAEKLGYQNINLAWPARSNDGIYESTVSYILRNWIIPKQPTSNLMVVIGWSSPERKDVILSSSDTTYLQTIWPAMANTSFYANSEIRNYFKFHVKHLWVEQEYIGRFIEHNYHLSTFLEAHGIRYFFFNAFYQTPNQSPKGWEPMNVRNLLRRWVDHNLGGWHDPMVNWNEKIERLTTQWDLISSSRFILKDCGSFKEYIDVNVEGDKRMNNWHPSPESHHKWAEFLHKYIDAHDGRKASRFGDLAR